MIIATAGHIDHGKTLLVKALTGTDTDRLPEELARGISIDLGFAYLPLENGQLLGFVDVPGHERFVRNMLAGVCAIDYALLVVAADDGVMPQTLEHLNILGLLNVTRGAVVISKIDRVGQDRVREVAVALEQLLAALMPTRFPIVAVSARNGDGIAELRTLLLDEATRHKPKQFSGQYFRFAIDRAFVMTGSGTVVTGTVFNGSVRLNDRLLVSRQGAEVRVRGIQVHRQPVAEATAGQRCALNLSGVHTDGVGRGDWVLHPAICQPSTRMDVSISLLASESRGLSHWTLVHVHVGSAEMTARVVVAGGGTIAPGTNGFAQLIFSRPVCAHRLDRFIIRNQPATRTLGGGMVLHPLAGPIRRRDPAYPARLAALAHAAPREALAGLVAVAADGVDLDAFEKICNLTPEGAAALYVDADVMRIGKSARIGIAPTRCSALQQSLVEALAQFHLSQPAAGQKVELLRRALSPTMEPDAFQSVVKALADSGLIEVDAATVRLPGHSLARRPDDEKLWHLVLPLLEADGFMPPSTRLLAVQLGMHADVLANFLLRKAATGQLVHVTADRFYPRATIATMAGMAYAMARSGPDGSFSVAQYRDACGAGRQTVINVLEYFDRLGITQREGNVRRIGRDPMPIFGSGSRGNPLPGPGSATTRHEGGIQP